MTTKGLRSLAQAIELFRHLDDDVPARVIHTFVVAANWDGDEEGPTMGDLMVQLGLPKSAVTRHVTALTKTHRLRKPGLNLVSVHSDARDPRKYRVRLTEKGKTLRSRLLNIMGD